MSHSITAYDICRKEILELNLNIGDFYTSPYYIIPTKLPYGFTYKPGSILCTYGSNGGMEVVGWLMDIEGIWYIDLYGAPLHPEVLRVDIPCNSNCVWKANKEATWRQPGTLIKYDENKYIKSKEEMRFDVLMNTYFPLPNS